MEKEALYVSRQKKEIKMLNHIGITINDISEIKNFYIDVFGLEIKRNFILEASISDKIFNIKKDTEVTLVGKDDFTLELFLDKVKNEHTFQHICIIFEDRKQVIKKAHNSNYSCTIIKREPFDIVFIKDNSNNIFELKQK